MSEHEVTTNASDPALDASGTKHDSLFVMAVIIVVGIFATTLGQPQTIGKLPLQHLLKDEIHVTKTQMASFFFLCGLAWYFKPLAGILTDAFPLFKTRRRHYVLISSLLAGLSWIGVGLVPHKYGPLLYACIIVNVFMVMSSTVIGAYLVEAGQRIQATGRLTALRVFVQNFCTLVQGPLSGFLAGGAFLVASGANAAIILSLFPVAWIFLREQGVKQTNTVALTNASRQLKTIGTSGTLWMAILFVALFYFSPGFSTPLYYRQTEELKMNQQFIGNLGVFSGGCGLLAAVVYSQLVKRVPLKSLLVIGVTLAAAGTLFYLKYNSKSTAMFCEAQNGFFFTLAELAILDFAARATPKGCEGLGYSLILSIRNVALFGADIVGSKLSDDLKWPFSNLVFLNSGTTAIVLILIPFLPLAIMRTRDR